MSEKRRIRSKTIAFRMSEAGGVTYGKDNYRYAACGY